MHYFTFADKDTTVYQQSSSLNAGQDEVLEIRKDVSQTGTSINVSRILIHFPLEFISSSIVDGLIPGPGNNSAGSSSFYLNLFDAKSSKLVASQSIYAYPVSQSWKLGGGRSYDNPITTEGTSWIYRHGYLDGNNWDGAVSKSGATWWSGSGIRDLGMASLTGSSVKGGNLRRPIGLEASFSFNSAKSEDVRMNVTDIVQWWLEGSASNEGFLVKRSGSIFDKDTGIINASSDEGSSGSLGNFSFFSTDTHTKYPPTLETVWDDSIGKWACGSLSPITGSDLEDMRIYMRGFRPAYTEKSKAKFRVIGRGRFPAKTYATTPSTLEVKYLPSGSSYYSIVDAETNEVVVPYGSGSKLSCDSTGNYFNLWMDGYQPERYYKIEYRVRSGSGTVDEIDQYFDEGFTFKINKQG